MERREERLDTNWPFVIETDKGKFDVIAVNAGARGMCVEGLEKMFRGDELTCIIHNDRFAATVAWSTDGRTGIWLDGSFSVAELREMHA